MKLEAIGKVHSCFKVKFGTPRQGQIVSGTQGYIEIEPKWEPEKSLKSLEEFSHAWILFWFHDNSDFVVRPVIRPPRLSKRVGIFASRTPMRPNPIGLSLVKIERVAGRRLYISGIDVIEGTPVLDIKPYIHEYDSVPNSSSGWLSTLDDKALEVIFTERAVQSIEKFAYPNLKTTIRDILASDIRNRNDRRAKNEGKTLGFYYEDLNVLFQTVEGRIVVIDVESIESRPDLTSTMKNQIALRIE